MKRAEEQNVKEKMESLGTLSAGIVFGKEDAWDKLQARMEAKPTRRIPMAYRLAAAAVLLIMLMVATLNKNLFTNRDTANKGRTKTLVPENTPASVPVATDNFISHASKPATTNTKHRSDLKPVQKEQTGTVLQPYPITVIPDNNVEMIAGNNPAPQQAATPAMQVVHLNDLDSEPALAEKQTPVAVVKQESDLSRLPVVHISDVSREENTLQRVRESKPGLGQINFRRPARIHNESSPAIDDQLPEHSIQIKINLQN